jgi:hypothetical protein
MSGASAVMTIGKSQGERAEVVKSHRRTLHDRDAGLCGLVHPGGGGSADDG